MFLDPLIIHHGEGRDPVCDFSSPLRGGIRWGLIELIQDPLPSPPKRGRNKSGSSPTRVRHGVRNDGKGNFSKVPFQKKLYDDFPYSSRKNYISHIEPILLAFPSYLCHTAP
jgi:hypothetical protein